MDFSMRLTVSKLLVFLMLAAPVAAGAITITAGPLTFGSNLPFFVDDVGYIAPGLYLVQLDGTPVDFRASGPQIGSSNTTNIFSFDIAHGWALSIVLGGSIDDAPNGDPDTDASLWAIKYGQKLTLCSTGNVCASDSQTLSNGQYPLPPINFNAVTGAGSGTYQVIEYAKDGQFGSDALPDANLFLVQTPVPEPASLALTATGVLAGIGVLRRKLATV
jgi:hypothetical protein